MRNTKAPLVSPAALAKPVWTFRRQLMGNLIPLIIPTPIGLAGIAIILIRPNALALGIATILASGFIGWICLSLWGLFENRKIKQEMTWRFRHANLPIAQRRYFVGVASPGFKGILDPHEDVGFLLVYADRLEFFGEKTNFKVARADVSEIAKQPNIHSFVFLGGWISVRGTLNKVPVELRFEPRIHQSLLANKIAAPKIAKRLRTWQEG
ncbi:MAG: hypothetical protein ABL949_12280 [Fimbriimonadaceae bacterium]